VVAVMIVVSGGSTVRLKKFVDCFFVIFLYVRETVVYICVCACVCVCVCFVCVHMCEITIDKCLGISLDISTITKI